MNDQKLPNNWDEKVTRQFIDFGKYFVPERERQIQILSGLLKDLPAGARLVELCCGEGLLAEVVLETYPNYRMLALDGSDEMLSRAEKRLARFGERGHCGKFELGSAAWRRFDTPVHAFLSSLAIHHLMGPEKQTLFKDLHDLLIPGGIIAIADVMEIKDAAARELAADQWDEAVRQRALELDGNMNAFEFFRKEGWNMYRYLDPDDIDKPSPLYDQLRWLEKAGFCDIEVNWVFAGHAIFSGRKASNKID